MTCQTDSWLSGSVIVRRWPEKSSHNSFGSSKGRSLETHVVLWRVWLVGEEAKPLVVGMKAKWCQADWEIATGHGLSPVPSHTGAHRSFCSFTWSLEPPGSWNPSGSSLHCLNCSFPKFWQHLQSTLPPSFPTLTLPEVAAGWTSEKTSVVSLLPCLQVSGASCGISESFPELAQDC